MPYSIFLTQNPFCASISKGAASTILHLWYGAAQILTHDLLLQMCMLYQLSYRGGVCSYVFIGNGNGLAELETAS